LQAYLPDSAQVQRDLTQWALERHARGGASIKLRLVKGANLAMEKVEAATHGWEQAPYYTKTDVDANFKRMVQYAFTPERAKVVNIGVASHNLFDITYALLLRERMGIHDYVEFEMLEGMANHQARAVQEKAGGLLLYAPVVKREDFHSAIAYLVRRLDENTAEENFLHDLFGLEPGSPSWNKQRDLFLSAVSRMQTVSDKPNRQQDRSTEEINFDPNDPFHNEPDTDFSLRQNQRWIKAVMQDWEARTIEDIPLQINGEFIQTERKAEGIDPAKPRDISHRYSLAQPDYIEKALQTAVKAQETWQKKSIAERKAMLVRVAEFLANRRGDFIGAMTRDGGKTVEQADPEVSEAIDFANYYARSFDLVETELNDLTYQPLGVVLITPPWNFPMAIPTGGVLAALMAGNTVIFKPAPEAMLVGWQIANALWDAGIPKDVLQFVPTTDDEVGKSLVTDKRVNGVILTGAYDTARLFLSWKPTMRLFAETSGKNSMIITAMSDRDQAVKDLVKSAFGHAGQKCSASSLAILEAEVYEDQAFLRQLKDAAESLTVGSAWNLETVVNPVIHAPEGKLQRALTQLDAGESWLLQPKMVGDNPNCWSPGIKLGVKPGSFFHQTECFGPVLGLIRADNLEHAIKIANDVDYGLTSGLHSLDDREIAIWREKIEAGNAYINRGTTGAIVQRQPFGGWKQSAFGYAKAGGPNYTLSLGSWEDASDEKLLERAKKSYQHAWDTHFSKEHDPSEVLGESNVFRYRRIRRMILRVTANTKTIDIERVALGAQVAGVALRISLEPGVKLEKSVNGNVTVVTEDEAVFLTTLQDKPFRYWQRVRVTEPVSDAVYHVAHEAHVPIIDAPVVSNGRIELRHYFVEQAMTQTMHRYGNLL
ncbi:MAG: proline dehydrogenase family protein, partial [Anaerolineae bacterium]|nr:proline dehydrogenase family protein [Anaerolineae bacterium]